MIVVIGTFVAALAQNPMVTLSHNGELSFFTNLAAFESAVDAAVNGDTIYLSEGDFVIRGGSYTIRKRLSIIGNGYGSHILGNITFDMSSNPNSYMEAPLFDGVRLDRLFFYEELNSLGNLYRSEIRRCWIRDLVAGGYAGQEVTYDKCIIERADFEGSYDRSVFIKNSKLTLVGYAHSTTMINCNIKLNSQYCPSTVISCILQNKDANLTNSGAITSSFINSVLNETPTCTSIYQHNCYYYTEDTEELLDSEMNCPLDLTELGYLGQDGTVVGIDGGDSPFSENPSVPTVDTAKSSVEYDAATNKLRVNITVKAD